jgi:hypothetical protein
VRSGVHNILVVRHGRLVCDALVGFLSTDRAHAREGGAAPWSTPLSGYRQVDAIRIGALGDADWIEPSGEWTYGRCEITSIAGNLNP